MKKIYQIIILICLSTFCNSINLETTFCENTENTCENTENPRNESKNNNTNKILIISFIILFIIYIFFLNNETLNYNIEELYKIAVEISNNSTVRGWELIHKVLKDLDPTATNNENIHQLLKFLNPTSINKNELIQILENLIKLDKETPNIFSVNSVFFGKSIKKLIEFIKNI
jgi:hypothetical protein